MNRISNEEIVEKTQALARQLGKETLEYKDLVDVASKYAIGHRFGGIGKLMDAAGLKKISPRERLARLSKKLDDESLFAELHRVELNAGREPSTCVLGAFGKYSRKPYLRRFGTWAKALEAYREWKAKNTGRLGEISNAEPRGVPESGGKPEPAPAFNPRKYLKQPLEKREPPIGEVIEFRGMRYAPTNELGVVALFGLVARDIGFRIETIQPGFPDAQALFLSDPKRGLWSRTRIEFEFRSSSFSAHRHDPKKCDFIVCWVHDWPACPLNVVELKSEIKILRTG
jgi:hypothetical protein